MRIRIDICYDGSNYQGWQMQSHTSLTIQGQIQEALKKVFQKEVFLHGSGRTDAGVHAEHQIAHFDIVDSSFIHQITSQTLHLTKALQFHLSPDILIKKAYLVPDNFHARLSATKKVYVYRILNAPHLNPFLRNYTHWISHTLDLGYLQRAADLLIGQKDFKSFQNSGSNVQNTNCLIFSAHWSSKSLFACSQFVHNQNCVEFQIEGERFLKQMVRNILGTLLWMEFKKIDIHCLNQIIEAKDRRRAYNTAPAQGLYLKEVIYPNHFQNQCLELDS